MHYIGRSRAVAIGGTVLAGAGALFLGWDWLAAAGLATLILGVLPCVLMCAVGICAHRMGRNDKPPTAQLASAKEAPSDGPAA